MPKKGKKTKNTHTKEPVRAILMTWAKGGFHVRKLGWYICKHKRDITNC